MFKCMVSILVNLYKKLKCPTISPCVCCGLKVARFIFQPYITALVVVTWRSHAGTGRSRNTILAVVVPLGTLLLAFVLTGVYLRRRRGVKEHSTMGRRAKDDCSTSYVHPEKFTLPVLRAATGNFAAENKLGAGGFGEVFKVTTGELAFSDREAFSLMG